MDKWSILLLTFLILVPIVAYRLARSRLPRHVFCITGVAFGVIVAPWSLGLYSWFFLSPIGFIPGMLGLMLVSVHETPGFQIAIGLGLVQGVEVASDLKQHAVVEVVNAVFWALCYGLVGYVVDYVRNKSHNAPSVR